jgi:hypothetical protein
LKVDVISTPLIRLDIRWPAGATDDISIDLPGLIVHSPDRRANAADGHSEGRTARNLPVVRAVHGTYSFSGN